MEKNKPGDTTVSPASTIANAPLQDFETAYANYLRNSEQRCRDAAKRAEEQYRSALEVRNKYATELATVRLRLDDAYGTYLSALRETWAVRTEGAGKRVEDAYRGYTDMVNQANAEVQRIHERYVESCRALSQQQSAASDDSYVQYVRDLQQAWSKADASQIDRGSLASIASVARSVAGCPYYVSYVYGRSYYG